MRRLRTPAREANTPAPRFTELGADLDRRNLEFHRYPTSINIGARLVMTPRTTRTFQALLAGLSVYASVAVAPPTFAQTTAETEQVFDLESFTLMRPGRYLDDVKLRY